MLPLVVYLFFATGINHFAKLPIRTKNVLDISDFSNQTFQNNITIVGFLGNNILEKKGEALNLNQKIYKRFFEFEDFQFVMLVPMGQENQIKQLKTELTNGTGVDLKNWKFVEASASQISLVFESFQTPLKLDINSATPFVFIIDKDGHLRGRDDENDPNANFGYDARSVAEINNKMVDDVKIILAEYRLALKKYNKINR